MTKPTMKLLEQNRQTHMSLQSSSESSDMQQDDKSIQEILQQVTTSERWNGQRASKLSLDDFLELLAEFHDHGIHFA